MKNILVIQHDSRYSIIVLSSGRVRWYTLTDASAARLFAVLSNCERIIVRDDAILFCL